MIPTKNLYLFAGVPVTDYATALAWYKQLLGSEPSFFPNEIEAVWELAENRYLYIIQQPEHAGHTQLTIYVDDLNVVTTQVAERGLHPAKQETFPAGSSKNTYCDPDKNEISFGGNTQ